jgi:hypothetical protein
MTKRNDSRQRRPDRRYRRLLPTVLATTALAVGALPSAASASPTTDLSLKPTFGGWALVTPAGKVAYQASGARARERCLRRAVALGAIRLR